MDKLGWEIIRHAVEPAVVATVTIAALTWRTRHTTGLQKKARRIERQVANLAGEVSAIRDEMECRNMLAEWMADPNDPLGSLFNRERS